MKRWSVSVEVWQRGSGNWTWVMFDRPDVLQPANMIIDSCEFPTAHAALADAEQTIDGMVGRNPVCFPHAVP